MTKEIGTELLITLATAVLAGCIEIIVTMVRRDIEGTQPTVVVHYLPKVEPENHEPEGSAGGAVSAIALIILALTLLSQCS